MRLRSKCKNLEKLGPSQPGQIPLSSLKPGERGVVVGLSGGRGLMGRMVSLGFTPGTEVTLLQNYGRGPLLVTVRDTRVALGRGEALKVLVEAL
ncbi:ferrous iron transport protein A [bacterium]|nr:ferrous iron transport protein A [bacterium]PIW20370.1 MAG: ferrous iron transport protein A [Anaerolineae bacterium CG17_big_fil_post_rev_8_21_14_2_50_57_27]PJH76088.1 MAG: ferrous iron transport protein A [Anaerolineae bacterium CG_4_9_14_0_8_um_filter_58_9]